METPENKDLGQFDTRKLDCGCYGKLPYSKKCYFSRRAKFLLQRLNILLIVPQFIGACVLLSWFYAVSPDIGGSYISQGDSVKDIMVGYLCFALSLATFLICCFGGFTVTCRCFPLLPILNIITFGAAITCFASGSLKNQIVEAVDNMCNEYAGEIEEFFNRVVDVPMCSDICPCEDLAFTMGGYDTLTTELQDFTRNEFSLDGAYTDNMLFTRTNLDDWLTQAGSTSTGYSQLTR